MDKFFSRTHEFINPFPNDQFETVQNWKSLKTTISNLMKMAKKFSKRVESTVGKGEIACYEQFLLFPQCFKRLVLQTRKNKGLFGKGLMVLILGQDSFHSWYWPLFCRWSCGNAASGFERTSCGNLVKRGSNKACVDALDPRLDILFFTIWSWSSCSKKAY